MQIQAGGTTLLDGGANQNLFFIAKQAGLAGVWIERANADAW